MVLGVMEIPVGGFPNDAERNRGYFSDSWEVIGQRLTRIDRLHARRPDRIFPPSAFKVRGGSGARSPPARDEGFPLPCRTAEARAPGRTLVPRLRVRRIERNAPPAAETERRRWTGGFA